MDKDRKGLISLFGSLSTIIILGKILGFIKQIVTASTFGATLETDLISLSEGLISNAEYLIQSTLVTAFVAVYLHASEKSQEQGKRVISDSIKAFSLLAFAITTIVIIFAPQIGKLLAPSYSGERILLLAGYLRLYTPLLIPYTLQSIFAGVLNSNNKFIPGQMMGINHSIVLIVIILLFSQKLGVKSLVLGFAVYSLVNVTMLAVCSKPYLSIRKGNPFKNEDIIELIHIMLPMLVAYSMVFVNQLIDRIIVSGMEEGAVTALNYGSVLSNLVTTFISTFCTVLYTKMAKSSASGKKEAVAGIVEKSTTVFVSVLLPITIIAFMCSGDIVRIIFGRGAFGDNAVMNASKALKGYCLCFIPFEVKSIYSRSQYGEKNTKGPTINTMISIFINIGLSLALYKPWGIFGVAFASSFAEAVCAILNIISAKKGNVSMSSKAFLKLAPVWLILGLLTVAVVHFTQIMFTDLNPLFRFLIITIISSVLYMIPMLLIFRKQYKRRILK